MEAVPLGRPKIEPSSTSFLGSKLSLYQVPPKDNVSLEEFELYAIERLRGTLWYFNGNNLIMHVVLKDVENISIRGLSGSAFSNRMSELVKAFPLNTPEGQTKDCISHWTLRFAYCQPDDRYWLVRQETDLFRYVFSVSAMRSTKQKSFKVPSWSDRYRFLPETQQNALWAGKWCFLRSFASDTFIFKGYRRRVQRIPGRIATVDRLIAGTKESEAF